MWERVRKGRCGLNGRVSILADIVRLGETKYSSYLVLSHMLLYLEFIWIQILDIVSISENESFLSIEAKCDDVLDVFDGHFLSLVERQFFLENVLFIIGNLDYQRYIKHVLEVLGENEWDRVTHVHRLS